MNENLRFIVSELKKSPWKKNFSIISFDSLSSEQVLQVLTDVLAEIDPRNKVDIQEENPEKMAVRMLGMLRAIKYRPPDIIAENFRRKLVEGDKAVVCSILQWILEKPITELKRRAYLAKYLVKVEIPPEVIYDAEVATLSQQYERLIDEFVAVHREWEGVMGGEGVAGAVGERRSDLAAMQRETQQVALWLQRMKAKSPDIPFSYFQSCCEKFPHLPLSPYSMQLSLDEGKVAISESPSFNYGTEISILHGRYWNICMGILQLYVLWNWLPLADGHVVEHSSSQYYFS